MRIYRGPKSKCLLDDSYENVADITGGELRDCIKLKSYIEFNITKNGSERRSVCTASFHDEDIVEMVTGLALRLKIHEKLMHKIQQALKDKEMTSDEKLKAIERHILHRNWGT